MEHLKYTIGNVVVSLFESFVLLWVVIKAEEWWMRRKA